MMTFHYDQLQCHSCIKLRESATMKHAGQPSRTIVWITDVILDAKARPDVLEILSHLAQRGFDVHLIAIRSKKRCPLNYSGVHIRSFPLRYAPVIQAYLFLGILLVFLPIYVLLKRPRFVITTPGPFVFAAFMWKPFLSGCLKVKTILDIRSTPVESSQPVGSIGRLAYPRRVMFDLSVHMAKRMFEGLTIITPGMKQEIATRFRIREELIRVWSVGVSTKLFEPSKYADEAARLREQNGLNGKFVVIYHGSLGLGRGVVETVRSIDMLKSRCDDVVLFLLGNGRAIPAILALVREKGLHKRVMIHDAVDYEDVPKYIAMSDVGIVPLPNIPEWIHQCPLKLLEYMAMEKPVIITDIQANRDIVGDSICGIYVQSSKPEQIAKAILYSRSMRDRLRQWGSYGRAIVRDKYDWERVAEHLEQCLASY